MNDFFNLDGPVFKFANLIADMVILSFLTIIFSIPLITAGASITAAYYVATRRISDKEGYIIKDFFAAFKREFLRTTIIFAVLLLSAFILLWNILLVFVDGNVVIGSTTDSIFLALQFVVLFEVLLIALYIFPIASRFDMKKKELLKTAFFMANKHILSTLAMLIVLAGLILFVLIVFEAFVFLIPGIYVYLSSYLFMRIFRKYRPEIDSPYTHIGLDPLKLEKNTDNVNKNGDEQ
jgi:uncharacterized membrane protein YesL